jgi:hypothetical protein
MGTIQEPRERVARIQKYFIPTKLPKVPVGTEGGF